MTQVDDVRQRFVFAFCIVDHRHQLRRLQTQPSQLAQELPAPQGVRGRNSDNRLLRESLGWEPSQTLKKGLEVTYAWIESQVKAAGREALAA